MAWYSILPPDLTYLETWAARIFVRLSLPIPTSPQLNPISPFPLLMSTVHLRSNNPSPLDRTPDLRHRAVYRAHGVSRDSSCWGPGEGCAET